MKKSEIRKKILKLRKENYLRDLKIDFKSVVNLLRKIKNKKKIIGGYYSYNYEANIMPILEKFEKIKYVISLPKISKNHSMNFFTWSINSPLSINKYGIPEPVTNKIVYPDILLVPLVAYDKNCNRIVMAGDSMTGI